MFVPDAKSIFDRYQTSEPELKLHDMIKDTVEKIAELAHTDKTDFTSADMIDMDGVESLVPEDLFLQIKDYLDRHHMTQKQFVLGLIQDELDRDYEEQQAMAEKQQSEDEPDEDEDEELDEAEDEDLSEEDEESEDEDEDEDFDESEDPEESEDEGMSMDM